MPIEADSALERQYFRGALAARAGEAGGDAAAIRLAAHGSNSMLCATPFESGRAAAGRFSTRPRTVFSLSRSAVSLLLVFPVVCSLAGAAYGSPATDKVLAHVRVPEGFKFEVFVDDVPGARSLAVGREGTIFVGTRSDKVYAVSPSAGEDRVRVIAEGLNMPNGVAFRDGALYVAEVSRILRYDAVEASLDRIEAPKVVRDDLPRDRHHGWKYLAFGPDGKLYFPIGAPCNVCNEPKYGVIARMNADGSGFEVFARGVRNSVGLAWHPSTGHLWFTDNGRDYLGDDVPPCELNVAPRVGLDFGFPYCHGNDIRDPQFGRLGDCSKSTPPVQLLDAHVAPLGLKFYTGSAFPEPYRHQVFIAEHGSWNRRKKSGYRITRVKLEGDRAISYLPFVVGFKRGEEVLGRPVDLVVLDDGSMLISDDKAGAIYRLSYAPVSGS